MDLLSRLRLMLPGSLVPVDSIIEEMERGWRPQVVVQTEERAEAPSRPGSWRERLWTAPAETRIGVVELAEATGRTRSWCYRHTSSKSGLPLIPHRKFDGELVFTVGEVRAWLREHEEVVCAGEMTSSATERSVRLIGASR